MSISPKTRKILWGRAGARCSFDGCRIELIISEEAESGNTILGEEAHIIAQKNNGPRGENPIEQSRINLYENLILLCPTHHTLIDAQPEKYSAEMLYKIKQSHESWVDHNLNEFKKVKEFHYIPSPRYESLCDHRLIHLWQYPKAHILCSSFGSNPIEILPGIWKGSGIEFLRFPQGSIDKPPDYLIVVSEAEFDVEYRCDSEALEITHYTYDPRIAGVER